MYFIQDPVNDCSFTKFGHRLVQQTSCLSVTVIFSRKTRSSASADRPHYVSKFVSRGMGARKFSNSESDVQGQLRALAMVSFDRPHAITY